MKSNRFYKLFLCVVVGLGFFSAGFLLGPTSRVYNLTKICNQFKEWRREDALSKYHDTGKLAFEVITGGKVYVGVYNMKDLAPLGTYFTNSDLVSYDYTSKAIYARNRGVFDGVPKIY